jgi:hypothetical protein
MTTCSMSNWHSTNTKTMHTALPSIAWRAKRQAGSHQTSGALRLASLLAIPMLSMLASCSSRPAISVHEDGYFEGTGGYKVDAVIQPDLTVRITGKL